MPALFTCKGTPCEKQWNVGSDDFVAPAILSIVFGIFNISLICAVLFAIYASPPLHPLDVPSCGNLSIPPLLYVPLFSLNFIEVCFIIAEVVILVLSSRGSISKETPSFLFREKWMPYLIHARAYLAALELVAIIAALVGVFHPSVTSLVHDCELFSPRLRFAQAVVVIQVIVYLLFLIKVCVYTDPLGCSTPGLMERLTLLDSADERGSLVVNPTGVGSTPESTLKQISIDALSTATEINIWKHRKTITFINSEDIDRVTKIHNDKVSRQKYERRLRAIFCCLGVRGQRSRGVALEDVAKGLYTIFSDTNSVLSDIIAGFYLLRKDQVKKKREGGEIALTAKFRKVTFKMMPQQQRYGFAPGIIREDHPFDFSTIENQILIEDLIHYMKYAMGTYGWPLFLFDNLCCGLCKLCPMTCCKFRCLHDRVKKEEFNDDNCCMCGIGSFRLQTKIKEEDILYVSLMNKIYLAPFIVCVDHRVKSLIICIRGTLSLKDALTDMSFSPCHQKIRGIKDTFLHGGMLRAARTIFEELKKKNILTKEFAKYKGYQLVVTGHSLGAGVASVLALLIKHEMKFSDHVLRCFAFSPPGALFSFPLAEYSKSFITSVVLGNDIVPRLSLRSLLHLKYCVKHLIAKCDTPKYKILCSTDLNCGLCNCFGQNEEEEISETVKKKPSASRRPASQGGERQRELGLEERLDERGVSGVKEGGVSGEEEGVHHAGEEGRVSGVTERLGVANVEVVLSNGEVYGNEDNECVGEEDDGSIEWMVLNKNITTASIRHQVFEKSVSIQPESLPPPSASHKLKRLKSISPYLKSESVVSQAFASKLQRAVSLDTDTFDGNFENLIKGTEHTRTSSHKRSSFKTSHEKSIPQPRTSSLTKMPAKRSESDVNGSRQETEDSHMDSENVFQSVKDPTSDPETSQTSEVKTASIMRVPLKDSIDEDAPVTRKRKPSDPTPGGSIDNAIPELLEHCRVDEHNSFTPFFPPGRMIHIQVQKSQGCCGDDKFTVMEVNRENMCVIMVDEGAVDDHLPNHVLHALESCKSQFINSSKTYDREAVRKEREKREELLHRLHKIPSGGSVCPFSGFQFDGISPMTEPDGGSNLGRAARRSHLKKQDSFDDVESNGDASRLHPPVASKQSLGVGRTSLGLTRISESKDEDEDDADVLKFKTNAQETVVIDMEELDLDTDETRIHSGTKVNCLESDSGSIHLSPSLLSTSDSVTKEGNALSSSPKHTDMSGLSTSSGSRTELRLDLSASPTTSNSSANKLLARRNASNTALKLTIPPTHETTPL